MGLPQHAADLDKTFETLSQKIQVHITALAYVNGLNPEILLEQADLRGCGVTLVHILISSTCAQLLRMVNMPRPFTHNDTAKQCYLYLEDAVQSFKFKDTKW
jgi:hypothetical protein